MQVLQKAKLLPELRIKPGTPDSMPSTLSTKGVFSLHLGVWSASDRMLEMDVLDPKMQ